MAVESTLPRSFPRHQADGTLLESNFELAFDDVLSYTADYALEPGALLAEEAADKSPAMRLGGLSLGQTLELQLPTLIGAPISLGLSTEREGDWTLAGYSRGRRERAQLSWSLGRAKVAIELAGTGTVAGAQQGLSCDARGALSIATASKVDGVDALQLSARSCAIVADDGPFRGAAASAWDIGYVWRHPYARSELTLSVVAPDRTRSPGRRPIEPGYRVAVRHSRDFGALRAETFVALHQPSSGDPLAAADTASGYPGTDTMGGTIDASLIWQLPRLSLKASWAHGNVPLWFVSRTDRVEDRLRLALDFSRWLEAEAFGSSKLTLDWQWAQMRSAEDRSASEGRLSVDLALSF